MFCYAAARVTKITMNLNVHHVMYFVFVVLQKESPTAIRTPNGVSQQVLNQCSFAGNIKDRKAGCGSFTFTTPIVRLVRLVAFGYIY